MRAVHVSNICPFVKAVCEPDNLITYASVRWPEAFNDARVFTICGLRHKLESGINLNYLLKNTKQITSFRDNLLKSDWEESITSTLKYVM